MTTTRFSVPAHCPACEAKLDWEGAYLVCPNKAGCKPQIIGRIAKWVEKLNILELGDKLIEKLVDDGLVSNPSDLYKLTIEQLSNIERMGQKSAENVHASLWKCNPVPLELFIGGLSINGVGSTLTKVMMDSGYDTLEKLRALDIATIKSVRGMGQTRAAALVEGLKDNVKIINGLLANGVQIQEATMVKTEAKSSKFNGQSYVFTGKSSLPRKELQAMVIENGGTCPSGVSKSTTYLVVADLDSGSTKIKKAEKLGTKVISEEEFMRMVDA